MVLKEKSFASKFGKYFIDEGVMEISFYTDQLIQLQSKRLNRSNLIQITENKIIKSKLSNVRINADHYK